MQQHIVAILKKCTATKLRSYLSNLNVLINSIAPVAMLVILSPNEEFKAGNSNHTELLLVETFQNSKNFPCLMFKIRKLHYKLANL